ncbi:HK97 gp10 family phage protein [Bacillus sp. Gen3]|uniref:HK97 gp10 family phage protein n=1 Tax=Heyndrickxia oleronia TaxID=38875 RepID=UPI0015D2A854|nr:HK97 gp10 family phage protein [Bacillus sp. Gen3]
MAKWGKVDFRQLKGFSEKLERLEKIDFDKFCQDAAKELAARLLRKVIKRTPVGQYPAETGLKGGTLRRGWTASSGREAELSAVFGGGNGAKKFANSLQVKKVGNEYHVEIINPVHYASYVEYGHRTRDHKGWVKGKFMLTISEKELDSQAPKILEKKLLNYLKGAFDD